MSDEVIDFAEVMVASQRTETDAKFHFVFERVAHRHKNMVLGMYQAMVAERVWLDREFDSMRRALAHAEEMVTIYKHTNLVMKERLELREINPADVIADAATRH